MSWNTDVGFKGQNQSSPLPMEQCWFTMKRGRGLGSTFFWFLLWYLPKLSTLSWGEVAQVVIFFRKGMKYEKCNANYWVFQVLLEGIVRFESFSPLSVERFGTFLCQKVFKF